MSIKGGENNEETWVFFTDLEAYCSAKPIK
jgi:hypothetical protein